MAGGVAGVEGVSYRPVCDTWILARPKVKYYGAFPAGFLHRARALLGVGPYDPVLHVCGGRVKEYPMRGFGANDRTVDLDPQVRPDYLMDVRERLPEGPWDAMLIDRPYTAADAAHYAPGASALPELNALVRRCLEALPVGRRVGVLDYLWPHPGKLGREVAVVTVTTGRNNRARFYTVLERL